MLISIARSSQYSSRFKAGVHLKPVFPPLNLIRVSRLRFKQQKLYAHFTKLCLAVFCTFFGDFWVLVKGLGLVKFGEIRNIKDLCDFKIRI